MVPSAAAGDPFSLLCRSCLARRLALGLAVVIVSASILAWVLIILFILKRRKLPLVSVGGVGSPSMPPRFSYTDLHFASHGFDAKNKLGEDRSGLAFSGTLPNGSLVVIKKLTNEGLIKESAFTSQIEIISRITHPNLLRLRGFCYDDGNALLVYEHIPHRLHHCLFGSENRSSSVNGEAGPRPFLHSHARLRILQGVGAALVHLHEKCILHRDVKAANVMLTEDLEPRLGDFGVARLIIHKQGEERIPACVAPEVSHTRKATEKADVYSFGVLALELACGRPIEDEQFLLTEWVWMLHQSNKLIDALDPSMREMPVSCNGETHLSGISVSDNKERQWRCVLHVALLCCHPLLEVRPSMRQAIMVIQESIIMPLPPSIPTFLNGQFSA